VDSQGLPDGGYPGAAAMAGSSDGCLCGESQFAACARARALQPVLARRQWRLAGCCTGTGGSTAAPAAANGRAWACRKGSEGGREVATVCAPPHTPPSHTHITPMSVNACSCVRSTHTHTHAQTHTNTPTHAPPRARPPTGQGDGGKQGEEGCAQQVGPGGGGGGHCCRLGRYFTSYLPRSWSLHLKRLFKRLSLLFA